MTAIDQRFAGRAGDQAHHPIRFLPREPRNSRLALELSLARGADLDHPSAVPYRTGVLLRNSIRQLVALSTATHSLSIQRRMLADVFDEDAGAMPLATVNTRVQTASAAITCRSVAALTSISEVGVQERSWHDLIVPPANAVLAEAGDDPTTALEQLPGEIADQLAGALALDRAQLVHAAPFLISASGSAVALFVMAGLPH